jgi:hypothetical protein
MRRPPNRSNTIVARTHIYTYDAKVWDLSLVQGAFSVAPCQPNVAVRYLSIATHPGRRKLYASTRRCTGSATKPNAKYLSCAPAHRSSAGVPGDTGGRGGSGGAGGTRRGCHAAPCASCCAAPLGTCTPRNTLAGQACIPWGVRGGETGYLAPPGLALDTVVQAVLVL